ncbi:MAG: hypothetical protein MUF34_30310 [Polyangiaceae bacterium]|nr:hypothetical protein [Polyangiaceae bacterium]
MPLAARREPVPLATRRDPAPLVARARWPAPGALLVACLAPACRPGFDESPGLVEGPRLLAVVAEGQPAGEMSWSFCQSPKPPADDNVVGRSCLLEPGLPLAWDGSSAQGALPADACARFGPDPPPGDARPRDADATGGFFQPVIVRAFGEAWAHSQRVSCALPAAPADVARAFAASYRPNRNPAPPSLEARSGDRVLDWNALRRGVSRVAIHARWPAEDTETYLWWNPETRSLHERRESMRLAWFVSAGRLDAGATGRDEGAPSAEAFDESENGWQLPLTPGVYSLWVVLRDARGGAGVAQVRARVVE